MVGSIDPRCETVRGTHWPKPGRVVVWSSRRGNHLGQRSRPTASTGRTYGCKRSDQTVKKLLCHGGRPHMGPRVGRGRLRWIVQAGCVSEEPAPRGESSSRNPTPRGLNLSTEPPWFGQTGVWASQRSPDERSDIRGLLAIPHIAVLMRASETGLDESIPFFRHPLAGDLLLYGIGARPSPDGVHEDRSANLRKRDYIVRCVDIPHGGLT